MDPAAMSRLLASAGALADGSSASASSALRHELRTALSAPAVDDEERAARVREAVACLQSPFARLAAAIRSLLAGEALGAEEWEVLDALIAEASSILTRPSGGNVAGEGEDPREEGDEDELWRAMARVFLRGTEEMKRRSREKRWTQWCDRVLLVVFAGKERGEAAAATARVVANALVALHTQLAKDGKQVEFRLATLVWKNLTKLAKSHTAELFTLPPSGSQADEGEGEIDGISVAATALLDVDETIRFALVAMEEANTRMLSCIQTWRDADDEPNLKSAVAAIAAGFKPLRLTCRAVQGQFLALASLSSSSQLEESMLATVNVASTLLEMIVVRPATTARRLPPKLAQEIRTLFELILAIPGRMASDAAESDKSTLAKSGWTIMQSLLWFPADDFVRAINERRQGESNSPIDGSDAASEIAIRWAHWCFLVEFVAADPTATAFEDGIHAAVELITKLLDRYQDCGVVSSATVIEKMESISIESMLVVLLRIPKFERLQLALLNFVAHPLIDQRHLCWAVWKELVCYCWDEETALLALNSLLDLAESSFDDGQRPNERVVEQICRLVAFMYPTLPLKLKTLCLTRVTSNIETICGEGPLHGYSSKVSSRLTLFHHLAMAGMLHEYDGSEKEQWIAAQLPMGLECCGTLINMVERDISTIDANELAGAMRVLETCLLVLKVVYDDNVGHEDAAELAELTRIVLPVVVEILSLLTKIVLRPTQASGAKRVRTGTPAKINKVEEESGITRVLGTCLYLLDKFAARLKRNRDNMCVKAMKNLLTLAGNGRSGRSETDIHQQARTALVVSFVKTALYDVQVAPSDVELVSELFTALFQRLGTNEKGTASSLLSWQIIDAIYGILAYSNVAEALKITPMLPASNTIKDLQELAMLHKQFDHDADALREAVASLMTIPETRQARADYVATLGAMPDKQPGHVSSTMSPSGVEEGVGAGATQIEPGTSSTGGSMGGKTKRQKLEHLVARCQQVIENCGATAENVTDQELDNATRILEHIIAKTLTF